MIPRRKGWVSLSPAREKPSEDKLTKLSNSDMEVTDDFRRWRSLFVEEKADKRS
jgi:hypothetical protein